MKNSLTKGLCALLCFTMLLSATACGGDKTWAMKRGDTTMPIGVYIYYLYQSFHEAAVLVPQDQKVLDATIENMAADTYIRSQANAYCKGFFWLEEQLASRNLSLSQAESDAAWQVTEAQWANLKGSLEKSGVSKDSFHQAYALYNTKYRKVFSAIYGQGGEKEIPLTDLLSHYENNSYSYTFMFAPLYQTTEEAAGEPLSTEQKTELTTLFQDYKQQIESGALTLEEAGNQFMTLVGLSTPTVNSMVNSKEYLYYPQGFVDALGTLTDKALTILESENNLVLLQKLPMADAAAALQDNPTQIENVLLTMKGKEFSQQVTDSAEKEITDCTINDSALNSIQISMLIDPPMLLGTKPSSGEAD